jgi:hypothetical protein
MEQSASFSRQLPKLVSSGIACLFNFAAATPAIAETTCMISERGVDDPEVSYKPRGSRCEGIYISPVFGALGMRIIGFQIGEGQLVGTGEAPIRLRVDRAAAADPVSLMVSSLNWQLHYQMDTAEIPPDGLFAWPTDVLQNLKVRLGLGELTALACTNRCRPGPQTVFYPVRVGAPPVVLARTATEATVLLLQSTVELSQVHFSVRQGGKEIAKDRKLPSQYFPTDRPIRVVLGQEFPDGEIDVSFVGRELTTQQAAATLRARLYLPRR